MSKTFIDPESGWKYGFPKEFPPNYPGTEFDFLYENGYPKDKTPAYIRYFKSNE